MYQRINEYKFIDAFDRMGRYDRQDGRGGNFTYEALLALFEYLTDLEYDLRDNAPDEDLPGFELDVAALCCDFAEYDNVESASGEYAAPGETTGELLDWFRDRTIVIEIPGTDRIIIQSF